MEEHILLFINAFSLMAPINILIFMKVRRWLNEKFSWNILFIAMFILAVTGVLVSIFMVDETNIIMIRTSVIPLYAICIYKLLYKSFLKIFKREPVDTFLNFESGISCDILFSMTFIVLTLILPMLVMAFFVMQTNSFKVYIENNSNIKSNVTLPEQKHGLDDQGKIQI